MTKETAKQEIEFLDYYLQNHTDDYSEESHRAMMMGVEALEKAIPLDKIREEIERVEIDGYIRDTECFEAGIKVALNIIDKYRENWGIHCCRDCICTH